MLFRSRDELAGAISEQEQHYNALGELKDFAGLLGQRLGEMHGVLGADTADPDFKPEITRVEDTQAWAKDVGAQIDRALQLLSHHQTKLNPADQLRVTELLAQDKAIAKHVQTLAKATVGGLRIRVHGDLHLGQILVVKGDAYLIDFEGEPARPLHERRGKHSPYKDVSGVLRSFDYAAALALNGQGLDHSPEAELARQRVTDRYLNDARQAFIQAYQAATSTLAHDWQEATGQDAALTLFSLEKAAYEVVYEAENRPSWLPVPLQGLHRLLSGLEPISKTARGGETS